MATRFDFDAFFEALAADAEARARLARIVADAVVASLRDEVGQLALRVGALAEAQTRTEARVAELAEAQARTEARVEALSQRVAELAEAQARTEAELVAFKEAVEARFQRIEATLVALAEAQARTEARLAELAEEVAVLTRRVNRMADALGEVRGEFFSFRYFHQPRRYFSAIATGLEVVEAGELKELLEAAVARGQLERSEARSVRNADLVLRGESEEGTPRYVVVEVSATINEDDVRRVLTWASALSKTGVEAVGAVAGSRLVGELEGSPLAERVWRVLDGRAYPPAA